MKLEEELMQYILAKQRLMPKIISSKLSSNNKKLNHFYLNKKDLKFEVFFMNKF